VACYGPSKTFKGTGQDLLGIIPVSTENKVFGAVGETGVEVVVPQRFASFGTGKLSPIQRLNQYNIVNFIFESKLPSECEQ
jgi:hypothetical protein